MKEQVTKQHIATIGESISDPLLVISKDYEIVFMNRAAKEMYGDCLDETKTAYCYAVTHGHDRPCNEVGEKCPVVEVFETGKRSMVVHKHLHDGEENVHEITAAPIFDDNTGQVRHVVEIVRDVTNTALYEKLQSSEARFRNLIESTPCGIVTMDSKGTITNFNFGAQSIFEHNPEDIIGENFLLLVPEEMRIVYAKDLEDAVKTKEYKYVGKTFESIAMRKSGEEFPVNMTMSTWEAEGEQYFTAIMEDITERKNLEQKIIDEKDALATAKEELTVKHEKMNKLFRHVENAKREWEQSMDCVEDIVLIANEDDEIVRVNRSVNKITDKPLLEILGRKWGDIFRESGMERPGSFFQDVEYFHRPSRKYYTVRENEVKSNITSSCMVVTLHDVTEQKRLNEELEKRHQELGDTHVELKATQSQILQQEKMASIGQLAAGVAHEINNPVGFITSNIGSFAKYVDKLREFINAQSDVIANYENFIATDELDALRKKLKIDFVLDDVKDLIRESLDGTDRVKTIVQNLKNFSRVDQSEHSMIDLNECMESTLNIVWNELKYKITVNKEYGEIPLTYCYPQQLNQVFMNLLVNGAQAIKEKGEITIKTWFDNNNIYVSISDTGSGIPEENLDRLFEPFFTTKEVGKGTGLGLSIAYDIVTKKHGGELLVESELDKGTTFTVKIPVVDKKEADQGVS